MGRDGRRRLLDGATRLLAEQSGSDTLALRELAREAGLNHNTFYRHFTDRDELLVELMGEYAAVLRAGIREVRASSRPDPWPTAQVVGWLLTTAQERADLFRAAYRILHGPPGPARSLVEDAVEQTAREMADDLGLGGGAHELVHVYVRRVFDLTVGVLDGGTTRRKALAECRRLLGVLVAGAEAVAVRRSPIAAAPVRVARPSRDLAAAERFWVDGLGLDVLWRTGDDAEGGHALLMVGPPGAQWHLELVADAGTLADHAPSEEDLLVLYLDGEVPEDLLARIVAAGGRPVDARNPYWDTWGVTVVDPDGYRLVLSSRGWG